MELLFPMMFQCHQESAPINIVLVLLNIIFKYNLKKTIKNLELAFFQFQGFENCCNFVKGVRKLL